MTDARGTFTREGDRAKIKWVHRYAEVQDVYA